jgi:superfamily II DNA/RNA helicase
MPFARLGLSQDLLKAVKYAGYEKPTSVQEKSIPLILAGKDLIAQAKTGTGKTASFALPVLQLLQKSARRDKSGDKKVLQALILAPTCELAMQINATFKSYGRHLAKPLRSILLVGGLNIDVQIRGLHHGAEIAVATPGRLLDLIKCQAISFSSLNYLVIDEADKMFDLGFAEEIEGVLKALPLARQNLLFSATMTDKVTSLAQRFMKNPVQVKEDGGITAERVHQRVIEVNRNNRGPLLRHLIQTEQWPQVLIFVASVRSADTMMAKLNKAQIETDVFHGGLTQAQRSQVLSDFMNKKMNVLVATDLAARGIDIEKLAVVVNYDLPRSADDYIHRIGRTARVEETGMAVTLIGHEDQAHFALIEKRMRIRLPRESVKGFELIGEPLEKIKGSAPIKGLRMSKKDKVRAAVMKKEGFV